MRPDGDRVREIDGADGIDGADTVLPPPRGLPIDPDDTLWHTGSFAAVTDEPAPQRKRKLTAGLAFLGAATTAVCTYAGVELAGIAGLDPPSPPRYVINEQANAQQGDTPLPAVAPPPRPALPPRPATVDPRSPVPGTPATTRGQVRDDNDRDKAHQDRSRGDKSDGDKSDGDKSGRRKHKSKSDD